MLSQWVRPIGVGMAAASLLAVAACNRSAPESYGAPPPPPMAEAEPPAELAGGPPPSSYPAPYQVATPDSPPLVVTMAPIPNPEDMAPEERARVYGPSPRHPRPWRHAEMDRGPHSQPAHRRQAAPHPHAATARPAPVQQPQAPSRAKTSAPPTAKPVTTQSRLGQLQTALASAVAKGAVLTIGPQISQGQPGQASLTLPATLLGAITTEAAKLGLSRDARTGDIKAALKGTGYAITPNGQQTVTLKTGKATRFTWQVAPGPDAKGPLTADVVAVLTGRGKPQSLPLGSLQAPALAAETAPKTGGLRFPHLPGFGDKTETADIPPPPGQPRPLLHTRYIPGLGTVSGKVQGLALLAVILAAILALASNRREKQKQLAERRRRAEVRSQDIQPKPGEDTATPS